MRLLRGRFRSRKSMKRALVKKQYGGSGRTYSGQVGEASDGRRFVHTGINRRRFFSSRRDT